jgi:hypothetical protein
MEEDLVKYFNGYFTNKGQFMSTNNSMNKSQIMSTEGLKLKASASRERHNLGRLLNISRKSPEKRLTQA